MVRVAGGLEEEPEQPVLGDQPDQVTPAQRESWQRMQRRHRDAVLRITRDAQARRN